MEKINIAEILKDAPKGIELYSIDYGPCYLDSVNLDFTEKPICVVEKSNNKKTDYRADGRRARFGEVLLFPSKENRDWSTFRATRIHKHFEPFEKVLVKGTTDGYYWWAALYSHYDTKRKLHMIAGGGAYADEYILPFEGNEDKLGKPVL